ncbi:hypothetical protein ACE1SV_73900 [Streptomyces sennicomposti]
MAGLPTPLHDTVVLRPGAGEPKWNGFPAAVSVDAGGGGAACGVWRSAARRQPSPAIRFRGALGS